MGSDVDLIVIVAGSERPPVDCAPHWDTIRLPVPADLRVFTEDEWRQAGDRGFRWYRQANEEAVWVYRRGASPPDG